MKRPVYFGALFVACLALGGIATVWLGATVLRLDREQRAYQEAAALEENVRLALWRMDSALGPFITSESMRPSEQYAAFYSATEAIDARSNEIVPEQILIPSPLMTFASPYVDLHFQIDGGGEITSPQVPEGGHRAAARELYLTDSALERSGAMLTRLRGQLAFDALLAQVRRHRLENSGVATASATAPAPLNPAASSNLSELVARKEQSMLQNNAAPSKATRKSVLRSPRIDATARDSMPAREAAELEAQTWHEEAMVPLWYGEDLLLVRTVRSGGDVLLQGCLLNWPALQQWLLGLSSDLLPRATLVAERNGGDPVGAMPGRQLAALPARLVPGELPTYKFTYVSPVQIYLPLAVGGIALATLAASALLWGALSLSERRGRFVSAVTHELRTPLTTFRLYTEMLATGMVRDEAKRQDYVETLHAEAGRLSHLVENVLAYARLDRGRVDDRLVQIGLHELIEEMAPRLAGRAAHSEMALVVEGLNMNVHVRVDPASVEQILFNLVDNACKYAASASDRRIHIQVSSEKRMAAIRVRDHGPGIPARDARRVFRPFTKSVHEAARTAPGVGLGLGLSRRLARALGGDLTLEKGAGAGACFVLRLPTSKGTASAWLVPSFLRRVAAPGGGCLERHLF